MTLWGPHAGPGSWQDLWTEEPTLEQPVPERWHPMGMTHTGEVHRELSAMGGTPCWSMGGV